MIRPTVISQVEIKFLENKKVMVIYEVPAQIPSLHLIVAAAKVRDAPSTSIDELIPIFMLTQRFLAAELLYTGDLM